MWETLDSGNAIDLDVEVSGPRGNVDEDAGWRVLREEAPVDLVHDSELFHRGAIHIALKDLLQRRSRRLEAKPHLLQHEFGLALDRGIHDLARVRIEGCSSVRARWTGVRRG